MGSKPTAATMVKRLVMRAIHGIGYDLRRLHPSHNPAFQLLKVMDLLGIDVVLDVGANVGQFSTELRSVGYRGRLISFEPLSAAHQALLQAAGRDPAWQVHERCALGDHDGEIEINVAGNSVSSSVLPMLEAHTAAVAGSAYTTVERVPVRRLDSVAGQYMAASQRPFLKVDTQGFEWQVLDGAQGIMSRLHGVLCELSLVPLYEGQRLWRDVIQRLEDDGFTLWSIQRGFTDVRNGRTLQVDAIFVRHDLSST